MSITAPHGSIATRESGRVDLLAFEINAKIEKEDIEWMAHQVELAFQRLEVVDMILVMRHYDGAELSAVFNSDALKSQADSAKHVRKYAVVGAPLWAKAMINLFSPVSPVDAKTFDLEAEADAWTWVNAPSAA